MNNNRIEKTLSANDTVEIPAGYAIAMFCPENTTNNAITGGLRIGTTDGGSEVLAATPIGANFINVVETLLDKRYFSRTAPTTLYIQAGTSWNGAILNITICLLKIR